MKCIYVAGAMSANNIVSVLENLHRGIKYGAKLFELGYAPYVPHLDSMFKIVQGDDLNVPMDYWYKYTMEFLTRCDAVFVVPKSEKSTGTQAEIITANELGIPVYYTIEELRQGLK